MNNQTKYSATSNLSQVSTSEHQGAAGTPPAGNTGVRITCDNGGESVVVDFLRMTVPGNLLQAGNLPDLLEALFLDDVYDVLEFRRGGHLGWQESATFCDGGILAWGGQSDTGCVDLSASALAWLESHDIPVIDWVRVLLVNGVRVTRLDLAIDDHKGHLTYKRVYDAVMADELISKSRIVDEDKRIKGGGGWTLNFGSRTSESFGRIYDKDAEQRAKRGDDYSSAGPWVRVEVEFKGKRAAAAAAEWWAAGCRAEDAIGLIRSHIDFREVTADSNVSRRPLVGWWAAVMGEASRVWRVTIGQPGRTIEDVAKWLFTSVAGGLAAAFDHYGGDFVDAVIARGHEHMSVRHRRLVMEAP